jgi:hypothetical protein
LSTIQNFVPETTGCDRNEAERQDRSEMCSKAESKRSQWRLPTSNRAISYHAAKERDQLRIGRSPRLSAVPNRRPGDINENIYVRRTCLQSRSAKSFDGKCSASTLTNGRYPSICDVAHPSNSTSYLFGPVEQREQVLVHGRE